MIALACLIFLAWIAGARRLVEMEMKTITQVLSHQHVISRGCAAIFEDTSFLQRVEAVYAIYELMN